MRDLYQEVTSKIVAALEAGTPPWIRPWSGELDRFPVNAGSAPHRHGIRAPSAGPANLIAPCRSMA
jgi:antirestriction protein ArdC